MTTEADIRVNLTVPADARPTPPITALISTTKDALQDSVELLASGQSAKQPDLLNLLRIAGGNRVDKTGDTPQNSVTFENFTLREDDIRAIQTGLDQNDGDVDASSYKTFDVSNSTFQNIMRKVGELQGVLDKAPKPPPNEFMSAATQGSVMAAVSDTLEYTHDQIEGATKQVDLHAQDIRDRNPSVPYSTSNNGGAGDFVTPSLNSTDNFVPTPTPAGTIKDIIDIVGREVGTREIGKDHVPGKEYNINDAWCSSFATWAWKKAGINVKWTNKNAVKAVWADAQRQGLNGPVSSARKGDLIVLNNQGHIGVVVDVDPATGTIHTVEGNSSDAVHRRSYAMNAAGIVGVVHPPKDQVRTPVAA